ncbi:MAG TPA: hypothetical protein VJT09_04325 [Pyrinomonadaceae bacterium]|nr:hypothetical protein [Pyrinomonadaceae bacterium]
METFWLFALIFVCLCLLTWVFNQIFFAPSENVHLRIVNECLSKQALKRGGTMSGNVLVIPHKRTELTVSYNEGVDEVGPAHIYATHRTELFHDKKFGIYYWKELFLRPATLAGSRLELFEEEFGTTYIVSGNDLPFVQSVLTPEIRGKILELASAWPRIEFGRPHGSVLSRERGWLTVIFQGSSGVLEADYDRVIEMAILFYERLEALKR